MKLAEKIAKEFEEEFKNIKKTELSAGEATAMLCALEERKKIQLEKQLKIDLEEKDSIYAKNFAENFNLENDEKERNERNNIDMAYAKEINDEQYAAELLEIEEREFQLRKIRQNVDSAADEKVRFSVFSFSIFFS